MVLKNTRNKNVKFKIINIKTGCQSIGDFYYNENLNWATQSLRLGHMRPVSRGLDIAALVIREGLQGGTPVGLPSAFLHKKNFIHSFCLPGCVNKFLGFCVLALLVLKNDHYYFSPPFCTCRFCVKSSFLNFWSNDISLNAFSLNKGVRGDSTFPTNGTRSENVWEKLH